MGPVAEDPVPDGIRLETRRGALGFFQVGQDASGAWWLLDPAGRPFWCKAVHGVSASTSPSEGELPPDAAARLRAWGFDAVGFGGDGAGREDGLAFFATVDFC